MEVGVSFQVHMRKRLNEKTAMQFVELQTRLQEKQQGTGSVGGVAIAA